jgi:hypothetical protein
MEGACLSRTSGIVFTACVARLHSRAAASSCAASSILFHLLRASTGINCTITLQSFYTTHMITCQRFFVVLNIFFATAIPIPRAIKDGITGSLSLRGRIGSRGVGAISGGRRGTTLAGRDPAWERGRRAALGAGAVRRVGGDAGSRTRTDMEPAPRGILSPLRLPVSPSRHGPSSWGRLTALSRQMESLRNPDGFQSGTAGRSGAPHRPAATSGTGRCCRPGDRRCSGD